MIPLLKRLGLNKYSVDPKPHIEVNTDILAKINHVLYLAQLVLMKHSQMEELLLTMKDVWNVGEH